MRRSPRGSFAAPAGHLSWRETRLRNGYTSWAIEGCYPFVLCVSQPAENSWFKLRLGRSVLVRGNRYIEIVELYEGTRHDLDEAKEVLLEKLLDKLKAEPGGA